jgi:hypothetical protein
MDEEMLNLTRKNIIVLKEKMKEADAELMEEAAGLKIDPVTEFARTHFSQWLTKVKMSGEDEVMLEPTPNTVGTGAYNTEADEIPVEVNVNGIHFTRTEVLTMIRLSNVNLND